MSYLVMECRRSYAVLLDQEGRFVKAANLRYEVGQTVLDPVLLEEPAPKLKLLPWIGGGAAGLAALAAALVFAVILPLYHQAVDVYSSIYLTINPQVQMDLNHAGDVVELTGTNGDGVLLLEGYDYTGKDRLTVADELVDRAIDMGFLEDGGTVNFSIDTPEESLFQEYGMELRDEVTHHLEGRVAVEVQVVHYSQEEVETMAQAFSKVYTFGPTFRAERSNTPRHASEFWHIEPEIAFADLNDDMDVIEAAVKSVINYVLETCPQDMEFCNQFVDKGLLDRLRHVATSDFARVTYTDSGGAQQRV